MTRNTANECGRLRRVLDEACAGGASKDEVTVLAPKNDPYRQDTPAGHADARWFAKHFNATITRLGKSTLHLRGLHYALVSGKPTKKPNGKPYRNTNADWDWLQGDAAKAARWLGYVPFEAIIDNRAKPPTIRESAPPVTTPRTYLSVGSGIGIPDVEDVMPTAGCVGFHGRQPYRLAIFGEKSSLRDVVAPIAERYDADLFLETGEISDTHIYDMAAAGARNGRPLRVFTLADFDPSGWQMHVSIGRKLQALRDLEFPDLDFAVIPVALNAEQVAALGLPSTPLKASEQRGDKWREAWGIEQTEIDALATLRPEILADLLTDALGHFYDDTLNGRVAQAEWAWRERAETAIREQLADLDIEDIHADLETAVSALHAVEDRLREATATVELPEAELPEPAIIPTSNGTKPLIASAWDWIEQTRRLKAWKAYASDGEG